jgi:hypothetical protein
MKKAVILTLLIALSALVGLEAQANTQKGIGVIIYADGEEVTVYRGNALKSYSVNAGTVFGLRLENGDLVQTGPGTFIEIQLLPSQSILKVAENTSFRLTGLHTAVGSTMDIIYGRIRAKIDPVLGQEGFSIRGKTAVAAVRGTDFGYDVVAIPGIGQEPSSQIYCFDGTVSVLPFQPEDWGPKTNSQVFNLSEFPTRRLFDVPANQMVIVYDTPDEGSKTALGKTAAKDMIASEGTRSIVSNPTIKTAINNFWNSHPDRGQPYSFRELQDKFYGIKLEETEELPAVLSSPPIASTERQSPALPRSSLADAIAPLPMTNPITALAPKQYVMIDSPAKLTGIIMGGVGIVGNLTGLALVNFGTDFGMTPTNAQTAGVITVSAASAILLSGLVVYIIGLFQ